MFKLNFDGASKGNPSNSSFGGICREFKDARLLTFLRSKGLDTNNLAEMEGLWQGLVPAQNKGLFPLIIEGDSQIIINMAFKILHGTPSSRMRNNWRLTKRLELIDALLSSHRVITLKHIYREGNKMVDLIASIGVDFGLDIHIVSISRLASEIQIMEYQNSVKNEMEYDGEAHSDVGEHRVH